MFYGSSLKFEDVCSEMSDRLQIQPHKHLEAMVLPPKAASAIQGTKPTKPKTWFSALSALRHYHLIRGCAAEPQNFQYMYTYYGLIAGGPDHGLTHHHLLSCELWRYLPDCFSCCWLCCHIIQFPNGHHNTCVFCKKPSSAFSPHLE